MGPTGRNKLCVVRIGLRHELFFLLQLQLCPNQQVTKEPEPGIEISAPATKDRLVLWGRWKAKSHAQSVSTMDPEMPFLAGWMRSMYLSRCASRLSRYSVAHGEDMRCPGHTWHAEFLRMHKPRGRRGGSISTQLYPRALSGNLQQGANEFSMMFAEF